MGRRVTGILAGTLIVAAAMVASAGAATHKLELTGSVVLDRSTEVRVVVTKRDGDLRAVKGLRLQDVKSDCGDGARRVDLGLPGKAAIKSPGHYFAGRVGPRNSVRVTGFVDHRGHRVRLSTAGKKIQVPGIGTCKVPSIVAIATG